MLAEPSVFESVVYAGTWLPYPMKPFELVLSVRWVDLVQVRNFLSDPDCNTLPSAAAQIAPTQECASAWRGHVLS